MTDATSKNVILLVTHVIRLPCSPFCFTGVILSEKTQRRCLCFTSGISSGKRSHAFYKYYNTWFLHFTHCQIWNLNWAILLSTKAHIFWHTSHQVFPPIHFCINLLICNPSAGNSCLSICTINGELLGRW